MQIQYASPPGSQQHHVPRNPLAALQSQQHSPAAAPCRLFR
jgi:hypothetical protein